VGSGEWHVYKNQFKQIFQVIKMRLFFALVSILLITGIIFSGCTTNTPPEGQATIQPTAQSQNPTPTPTATPAATADDSIPFPPDLPTE
jgi:zona occludens toxin (predicted ATPase)